MTHAGDSTNIRDFEARLREHLHQSKTTGRPLFVTSNGQTEAVVLSPAVFDELTSQAELTKSLTVLDRSEQDIKAGRTRPAKAGIRQIAHELNIQLDRA